MMLIFLITIGLTFIVGGSAQTGSCALERTGAQVTQGILVWPVTMGNFGIYINCPYGVIDGLFFIGARRYCRCNNDDCLSPSWEEPDTSRCRYRVYDSEIANALSQIYQDMQNGRIPAVDASNQLVNLTNDFKKFGEEEVSLAALILENIVSPGNVRVLNETGENIVKSVDNILSVDPAIIFQSQNTESSSTRILSVVEDYLGTADIKSGGNIQQNKPNIAVYSQDINQTVFQGAGAESFLGTTGNEDLAVYNNDSGVHSTLSQSSITIPHSVFQNLSTSNETQKQRIFFVIYRSTSLFQPKINESADGLTVHKLNSWVISGSLKGKRVANLKEPIVTTYQPLKKGIPESTECVFWDSTLKNDVGDWSQSGCSYQGTKNGIVTCHCSHLTNYAMLMDVYINDGNEDSHEKALSIISYIGCAISLVGLVLTIITILSFKNLRTKEPTQILLNFCIALSMTLIVFIAAAERSRTSSTASCRAAAVALHYFVLAVFMWMAVEAYNMYICFVKVLEKGHNSYFMTKCLIAGWGLPAIIVVVTAALEIEEYGDETYCRLQGLPFQVAFLAPVLLILVFNFIAYVFILHSLLNTGSKVTANLKTSGITQARRGIAILVVLGLTWLFGVLAIKDAKLAFQYLFCIFNSIQGLLVFIFYCALSKETRKKWKISLFSRKQKSNTSTGRQLYDQRFSDSRPNDAGDSPNRTVSTGTVNYGSSPSHASTSLN